MLKDKIVVVTGGAGLLGRKFCRAIAEAQATVVVADIEQDAADVAAAELATTGYVAVGASLDITSKASIDQLIDGLHNRFGRIDAVVNNAYPRNKRYGRRLEDVEYEDFCENVSLHLGGYFLTSQRFALYFKANGGGNIINMASIYGVIAPRFDIYEEMPMTMPVEYAGIKSGVIHLSKYFAQYFKKNGIRCNVLSPGGILDGQPDQFIRAYEKYCGGKGMLAPDDITGALLFLLSDHSRYMTGQNLIVDDAFTL